MSEVTVEKRRYKFAEYAPRKLKSLGIKDLIATPSAGGTCKFYDLDNVEVAYICLLEDAPGPFDNRTIHVYDKKWVRIIGELLNEWKKYYHYSKPISILLPEYEEV